MVQTWTRVVAQFAVVMKEGLMQSKPAAGACQLQLLSTVVTRDGSFAHFESFANSNFTESSAAL